MWNAFESGETIGTTGSEDGVIIRDEVHAEGARLTLESDGVTAPYSITSGVYGEFFHTTFLSSRDEAEKEFEAMRAEIDSYLNNEKSSNWIEEFINRH
ncbi:hypothetical protein ACSV5M_10250 [Cellvibrio sp. ARAG 10.3]|uniref:hypothetical protein n=1 Tax=Cellvibrio sp. ARAG 10.3 TaxID=3451358 RepID=UPI003F464ED0